MYRHCPAVVLILIGLVTSTALHAQDATELCQRGMARIEKGDLDGGVADLNQALKADPNLVEAYFARGYVWNLKDQHDKAIADFSEVIRLEPRIAEAHTNRGLMWEKKADYDKAFADYNEAFRLDPNNFFVCNNLAWMQATCLIDKYRDGRKALETAQRAHRLRGGDDWRIVATMAAAFAENGDFEQARKWHEKAVKLIADDKSATDKEKESLRSRLEVYKTNKPYRKPMKAR
jgi:tetratricopeptide (TPR) repeat protein